MSAYPEPILMFFTHFGYGGNAVDAETKTQRRCAACPRSHSISLLESRTVLLVLYRCFGEWGDLDAPQRCSSKALAESRCHQLCMLPRALC
jgi:hypothetical protein